MRHNDITRVHFMGTAQRLIYVKLPAEDRQVHGEDKLGRLLRSMYGSQDASRTRQLDYVDLVCIPEEVFRRGN